MLQWDWDEQRDKIARALAVISGMDLWKLFRPRAPDERLLQTWTQSVCPSHPLHICALAINGQVQCPAGIG